MRRFKLAYHVKRSDREISDQRLLYEIVERNRIAVLALCRDGDPYIVTLSYGFGQKEGSLYFHCARSGLKIDFLRSNPKVCATIIEDQGFVDEECDHAFCSVVIRGSIKFVDDEADKLAGITIITKHFEKNPERMLAKANVSNPGWLNTQILKLRIDEITGKKRIPKAK
jgi:nitroimidazol reductase NimA-like FMN-containing flavoprotein (pyridoxamine 5'-phosphate oxidase superfamily)